MFLSANLGTNIATMRGRMKISQKELGNQLNLPASSIAAMEAGTSIPSDHHIHQMARIFQLYPEQLKGKD